MCPFTWKRYSVHTGNRFSGQIAFQYMMPSRSERSMKPSPIIYSMQEKVLAQIWVQEAKCA